MPKSRRRPRRTAKAPELIVGATVALARAAAREAERGRALRARKRGWAYWKAVALDTYREINDDRVLALAAGVVFYGLLALFPAITAFVSSYALFAKAATVGEHLNALAELMPEGAFSVVQEQVGRIVSSTTGGLSFAFAFGLAFAIWSANAGVKAIIDALNIVYGVKDRRSFLALNAVALLFTVGSIVAALIIVGAVVVTPLALSVATRYGFITQVETLLPLLRWPFVWLLMMTALSILYRFGPDRDRPRWQWLSAGTVAAVAVWTLGSAALSLYLSDFADYDATYGTLGAGIGLMMWLWISAIAVLIGAEINSVIEDADNEARPFPGAGPDRIGGL